MLTRLAVSIKNIVHPQDYHRSCINQSSGRQIIKPSYRSHQGGQQLSEHNNKDIDRHSSPKLCDRTGSMTVSYDEYQSDLPTNTSRGHTRGTDPGFKATEPLVQDVLEQQMFVARHTIVMQ